MKSSIKQPIHFVGIGGSGMSPLAEIALRQGYQVSGSDQKASPALQKLATLGAKVFSQQHPDNLTDAGTVVVSSAIKTDNPELQAAQERNLPILHRSDLLKHLMTGKKAITIAGTHGKTTTSALIAHMLHGLGLRPTAAIGGRLVGFGSSALVGDGDYFVAEADESDGSFLKYDPYISVLTNVDDDHLDFYKNKTELMNAFRQYLFKTDAEGCAVVGWDDRGCHEVAEGYPHCRLTYGFRIGSEVRALNYQSFHNRIRFKAVVERDLIECELPAIGMHNVMNALCALAVARALELDIKAAARTLADFRGVDRRQTLIYASKEIQVYDDYAHNPGKISACVSSVKEAWPDYFLHVIYQPHRYSRLDTMYNKTMAAFAQADFVSVLPVYAAGERPTQDYTPESLAADIQAESNTKAGGITDVENCVPSLRDSVKGPTIFLTVGAGDVWKVSHRLGELLHGERQEGS